jgi:putative ABC transport system permease protein
VYLLQLVVGVSIPLIVASIPIWRSTRVTVLQAINDYGIDQAGFGSGDLDAILLRFPAVSRPMLLSVRNTFRRTDRLALTLSTLAVSGAIFMAALNVLSSWNRTLDDAFQVRKYDIEVRFQNNESVTAIENLVAAVPGVNRFEARNFAAVARSHPGEIDVTRAYPGGIHGGFSLIGLPVDTTLLQLSVVDGRWLEADEENAIVINQALLKDEPDLQIGSEIELTLNGAVTRWSIVGIVSELGFPAAAYTPLPAFERTSNLVDVTNNVRLRLNDPESQEGVAATIETRLAEADIQVASMLRTADLRTAFDEHITILLVALFAVALLTAAVGGLGLTSTMSMNVLERVREFGVMRTIGAKSRAVLAIVVVEGLLIGALSWVLAALSSIPLTFLVAQIAGQVGLGASLSIVLSPLAIGVWLGVITLLAGIASSLPASNALSLTVREVLAYQ